MRGKVWHPVMRKRPGRRSSSIRRFRLRKRLDRHRISSRIAGSAWRPRKSSGCVFAHRESCRALRIRARSAHVPPKLTPGKQLHQSTPPAVGAPGRAVSERRPVLAPGQDREELSGWRRSVSILRIGKLGMRGLESSRVEAGPSGSDNARPGPRCPTPPGSSRLRWPRDLRARRRCHRRR